ncbi:MAG: hypothetical protein NVS9B10_15310 [Nevskia sp.]
MPNASAATGSAGTCLNCSVTAPNNAIDADATNFAAINTAVGVAGSEFLAVQDTSTTYPAGRRVGFVVADPAGALLTLNLLQNTTVTTFNNTADVDTSTNNATLALDLVGTPVVGTQPVFVSLVSTAPFVGVRLNFGATLTALASLNVFQACVSVNPVPATR